MNFGNAALNLTEQERAKLASDLMASLDGPSEGDVAEAWEIEICRRINDIASGKAELLDLDEVLAKAKSRIGA